MSPRQVSEPLLRDAPLLHDGDTVEAAARALLATDLPALPVVDDREKLVGIFGEREFLGAVFPGYLKELKHAGFVRRSLDEVLEKRDEGRTEPVRMHMNTEHVHVDRDFSDLSVAEIFLHHRVLLVPVTEGGRVAGVITRADFFRSVAGRFLGR
ncbi:MAG TPA: CBS domain-containing protein [Solirubrobacteraceae bacterium]|nr:CBS domain-containing protein [Solirubrobacteraceae bacterium]